MPRDSNSGLRGDRGPLQCGVIGSGEPAVRTAYALLIAGHEVKLVTGLATRASCRAGIVAAVHVGVRAGRVEYAEKPLSRLSHAASPAEAANADLLVVATDPEASDGPELAAMASDLMIGRATVAIVSSGVAHHLRGDQSLVSVLQTCLSADRR